MALELPDAVFHADGDRFVPTDLARGPWYPDAMHGGAPAALVARAAERFEPGPATFVARITLDMLRPVPMSPLTVEATVLRPGKRVQIVDLALLAGGEAVVRARAVRLREAPVELPDDAVAAEPVPPGPEGLPEIHPLEGLPIGFHSVIEPRAVVGSFGEPGPATCWFRLRRPIVAGEETSPLVRAGAFSDFGNGLSSVLPFDSYLYINPDITLELHRRPEGEWLCLDARTWVEPNGVGMAENALHDARGRVGRAVQTLLVDRLRAP
ncbi:MAG: thioesterase family protein [Acidimicrobiia bacterium]|nr:thioesterase family protein [Acidimicrobiia bacterium]